MKPSLHGILLPGLRLLLLAGAAVLAAGPYLLEPSQLAVMTEFFCLLVLALMWNLLAGYADIVSVGQHAFVGVGAYAFYGFAALLHVDPFVSIVLAGIVALALAVPTMAVVFRLRAVYLAVGTWVVAEVLMLAAGKLPAFGGGSGTSLPISVVKVFGTGLAQRYGTIYWMAFALAGTAFVATWLLLRSRVGLGLTAMRDNEEGAGAIGVNLTWTRALCFLWTAPFLGLAGALITLQKLRISPAASFSVTDWTVFVIFMVVIGGIGSLEGPLIGTAVFMLLREHLAGFGTWYLMLLGSLSILVILAEPQGLWGLLRRSGLDGLIPLAHHSRLEAPSRGRPWRPWRSALVK
jgi:branched-chain amino acid transport system permease protein